MSDRKPREWLVAWLNAGFPHAVAEQIKHTIKPQFPDELLEIRYDVDPLLIFLRVSNCSPALRESILHCQHVCGFLGDETLKELELPSEFKSKASDINVGDLVVITVSPLRGRRGTVVGKKDWGVVIRLSIFGRLIRTGFQFGEVAVCEEGKGGSCQGGG